MFAIMVTQVSARLLLDRKAERSGMKRRKGPTKVTQGADQIEPESQK